MKLPGSGQPALCNKYAVYLIMCKQRRQVIAVLTTAIFFYIERPATVPFHSTHVLFRGDRPFCYPIDQSLYITGTKLMPARLLTSSPAMRPSMFAGSLLWNQDRL